VRAARTLGSVLVLALDTATPVVTAGLVDLPADGGPPSTRTVRAHDGRKHGELLMPAVRELCEEAGVALGDVDAVVTGVGPGPFTGLRVGIVSAAALGDALGVPVHGVCSLDAIALSVVDDVAGNLLVVTDARRKETYWAAYDTEPEPGGARRLTGPSVEAPLVLADRLSELGIVRAVGDPAFAEVLGIDVAGPHAPTPDGLVVAAADGLRTGADPAPLEPLYLRRPDAVEPTGRKRVTAR
jgi:tRNA threonylcarbamoyl adenosine modification protein YeaZ